MLFVYHPKCTTCQKAEKWLSEHSFCCEKRDIRENRPSLEELREWWKMSGLPLQKWFNTSGLKYRELGLKDKLPSMTEEEKLRLLASDGMLVKRPIFVTNSGVLVGFRETEWTEALQQ